MTGIILSIIILLGGGSSGPTDDGFNTANSSTTQTVSAKHK